MQIIRATCQSLALEPLDAHIRDTVVVGVGQLPDAGRRGDIDGALKPHHALGQHHFIGERNALVEAPVAVAVFEPHNTMRFLFELLLNFVVGAG